MDSRFSVDLLPYIWPVVGRSIRRRSRYLYWLEDGVALMVVMYSGAMVARNIDATAPLGATRVSVSGVSTVLPRGESVNATVGSDGVGARPAAQPRRAPHKKRQHQQQNKEVLTSLWLFSKKTALGKQLKGQLFCSH